MAGEGSVTEQMNELHVAATNGAAEDEEEDVVDPWKVESKSAKGVDYDKLISTYTVVLLVLF